MRDQMFSYNATTVKTFEARAVNLVQIKRRRIQIGDSDTQTMDGLVPVTRPIQEGQRKRQRGTRGGKSLHLRGGPTARTMATKGSWRRGASGREGAVAPQQASRVRVGRHPIRAGGDQQEWNKATTVGEPRRALAAG